MNLTEADVLGLVKAHSPTLAMIVQRLLDEVRGRMTRATMNVYREAMGKATWVWDQELGMHIPTCSGYKYSNQRGTYQCGNGPLNDSELASGVCSEGPHLTPHERSH